LVAQLANRSSDIYILLAGKKCGAGSVQAATNIPI
jgi:hypothetical protein